MHALAHIVLLVVTLGGSRHHGKPYQVQDGYTVVYARRVVVR